MLGPGQKAWLFHKLRNSNAAFRVIASSVPWASGTKPGSRDTWDGFPGEREEIFSFLEQNRIEGVVLVSADRHRSDAWRISRPDGYDLYDFSSSKLTNAMSHPLMKGCLFGDNEQCSFGSLIFDTESDDPAVTYRIINIDGDVMHSLTLTRSELSFR
jgi:alkaline phosphatase D